MKNITRSIHVLDYLALDSKKCPQTRQNIENSHTKQGSAKKKYMLEIRFQIKGISSNVNSDHQYYRFLYCFSISRYKIKKIN